MLNQWNTVFSVAKSAIKERLAEILVFLGAIPVIKERAVPVMDDNNVTALGTYTSASNLMLARNYFRPRRKEHPRHQRLVLGNCFFTHFLKFQSDQMPQS